MSGGRNSRAGGRGQRDASPALVQLRGSRDARDPGIGCEAAAGGQGLNSPAMVKRPALSNLGCVHSTCQCGHPSSSLAPRCLPRFSASAGFTLLELIVAIAVFAVVATMAYSGLDLLLRSRESLETQAQRQRELELAVLGIERDLRQALARPARGPYGDEQPALIGSGIAAEWTVLDLTSARDGVRTAALRVRYALVDGALWRSRDAVLDRSPRDTARTRKVLGDVERLSWRFVAAGRQRLDQWPPRTGITAPERLPRAVEVTLTLKGIGEIVRLVELPEAPR